MTDYDKLSDGELDERVAVEVMGWHMEESRAGTSYWTTSDGEFTEHTVYSGPIYPLPSNWKPSTSIADAWEVVLKAYELGLGWMLISPNFDGSKWEAYQATGCADPDFGEWFEVADTAPRAICLAALRAKEEE